MKNDKLISVSIGIAAYNEERNIVPVVTDILSQKRTDWALDKIYVACGGCTDGTVEKVRALRNTSIVLLVNPKRQGKAVDEQKIFDACKSDVLVMFDADVRLKGTEVVDALVHTMTHTNVNLVGGNSRPYAPVTFFERAVYTTFMTLDASRRGLKGGNNIYGASGQVLAMRNALVKSITFPKGIVAEDDYIYFTNLREKGGFRYCKEAIVSYKLPKRLPDYFRQVLRSDTASASANVVRYFGAVVGREYHRPADFYARIVFKSLLWNPVGTIYMIGVRLLSRIIIPFTSKYYSIAWYTAGSTK